mgnify:CR=1 FL=1
MRSSLLVAAVVVGLLALHFGRAALGGDFVADRSPLEDVYHVSLLYERWAASLRAGAPPLWMPEFGGGYPAPAAWMYGLLYPGLAAFLFLPAHAAWTWTGILHAAFGAAGMERLVRAHGARAAGSVTAGLLFGLSEFMVGRLLVGHLNLVMPLAWAPWVLLHAIRTGRGEPGAPAWLAVTAALGLLSGHVETWFLVAPLAVVLVLVAGGAAPGARPRDALQRGGLAALVVLLLLAVQWLPTLELTRLADPPHMTPSGLRDTSAPLHQLAARLVPGALGNEADDSHWVRSMDPFDHEFLWIGGPWLVLLAALVRARPDRLARLWLAAAVVGVVVALGEHAPWGALLHALPPFSWGRTPGRALVLPLLALPVLAGLGVSTWLDLAPRDAWRRLALAAALAVTVFGVGLAEVLVEAGGQMEYETRLGSLSASAVRDEIVLPAAWTAAGGLVLVALALLLARRGGGWRALPAIACGAAALWVAAPPVETVDASFHEIDWTAQLPEGVGAHRVQLYGNRFAPVERQGTRTLREICHVDTPGFRRLWADPGEGYGYWLDVAADIGPPGWSGALFEAPRNSTRGRRMTVSTHPALGPGALFTAAGPGDRLGDDELLAQLRNMDARAWIDGPDGRTRHDPLRGGDVRSAPGGGPLRVAYDVVAPAACRLVVSEKAYPGWTATVDGVPVEIATANLALRSVPLPAGRHRVEFVYRPLAYRIGLTLTIVGCAAALYVFLRARRGAA